MDLMNTAFIVFALLLHVPKKLSKLSRVCSSNNALALGKFDVMILITK